MTVTTSHLNAYQTVNGTVNDCKHCPCTCTCECFDCEYACTHRHMHCRLLYVCSARFYCHTLLSRSVCPPKQVTYFLSTVRIRFTHVRWDTNVRMYIWLCCKVQTSFFRAHFVRFCSTHTHTAANWRVVCFGFKIDSLRMLFSYCCLLLLLYAISIVHRIFDWAFRNTRAHLVSIFVSIDLFNEWYDENSHDFLIKRRSRFRCVTHIYATKNEIHWFRI